MPNQQKPLEGKDARIAAAQSWARAFEIHCAFELEGKPNQLPRAAAQLVAAIEQIDGKETDIDDQMCKCGATRFMHFGADGSGECTLHDCTCQAFNPVTK